MCNVPSREASLPDSTDMNTSLLEMVLKRNVFRVCVGRAHLEFSSVFIQCSLSLCGSRIHPSYHFTPSKMSSISCHGYSYCKWFVVSIFNILEQQAQSIILLIQLQKEPVILNEVYLRMFYISVASQRLQRTFEASSQTGKIFAL